MPACTRERASRRFARRYSPVRRSLAGVIRSGLLVWLLAALPAQARAEGPAPTPPAADAPRPTRADAPRPTRADAPRPAPAEAPTPTPADDRVMEAYREYLERFEAGDLAEALGPAKRAYDYAQQDLGVDDDHLALTAATLGSLLLDLDRPVDALRPLTHARELYDHQRGPSSARSRIVQRRIAEANQKLERYETAELTYLDLIERAKGTEGDPTAELAGLYSRLQRLAEEAGVWPRSRRYGLQAMKLYAKARGPESLPEGLVAVRLARGALEAGDWDEGLDLLDYGVPIVEKRLERGDPQLSTLYGYLVEIYEKIGDAARERRYRVRLKKNQKKEAEFARRHEGEAPEVED